MRKHHLANIYLGSDVNKTKQENKCKCTSKHLCEVKIILKKSTIKKKLINILKLIKYLLTIGNICYLAMPFCSPDCL